MRRTDLLFHAGGECVQQYGTIVRKTLRDEDNGYTHTRSGANATSNNGAIIGTAAANVPRIHYEGSKPYLLVEDERTNELVRSAEFQTSWTNVRSTETADAVAAPDGTVSADKLLGSTDNNTHYIYQAASGLIAGQVYSASVYAKAADYDFLGITVAEDAATSNYYAGVFNIASGSVNLTGAGGTSQVDGAYVEDVGNGWYRCVLTGQVENSATTIRMSLYNMDAGGTLPASHSFVGSSTLGIYLWGAQLEDFCKAASSYIPTTSAAATRSADNLYATVAGWQTQPMTVYARFLEREVATRPVFHIGSTSITADPRLRMIGNVTGYQAQFDDGTTLVQEFTTSGLVDENDSVETRVALNADGTVTVGVTVNNGAEVITTSTASGTLGAAFAGNKVYFGGGPASPGNRPLESFKVARGVRTMAEMRGL